jgi:hypothetical protein
VSDTGEVGYFRLETDLTCNPSRDMVHILSYFRIDELENGFDAIVTSDELISDTDDAVERPAISTEKIGNEDDSNNPLTRESVIIPYKVIQWHA